MPLGVAPVAIGLFFAFYFYWLSSYFLHSIPILKQSTDSKEAELKTNGHNLLCFGVLLAAVDLSGCHLFQRRLPVQPIPPAFATMPTLDQLITHINTNTAAVRQLSTNGATLDTPGSGIPQLNVDLSLERPKKLRLLANTSLTGTELDLGSNDELFWFWIKRNDPPAVFYARHGQFHDSAAKQIFPVEPNWLIEAIGLVEFDPADRHEGPYQKQDGRLEIRSMHATPTGEQTRVTLVDSQGGWVVEQHVYDEQGQLLASAFASRHQRDPASGAVLPLLVEMKLPPAQLTLRLDVRSYVINQLYGDPAKLFALPQLDGHQYVDLADPRLQLTPAASPAPVVPPAIGSGTQPSARLQQESLQRTRGFRALR